MNPIEKARGAISAIRVRPMSTQVAEVRQNINLIQEAMKATMKKDVHYGVIPGCGKPSLYKAGAEVIMALFKLSTDPVVTNMSDGGEIRYQVKVNVTTRDGQFIGSGIGECSSGEEKYSWRSAVCPEEFAVTPETLRRIKFKKDRYSGKVEQIEQVRVAPSDMANTILKMAKKRALIDAVLTATGASDIFAQDIEDLPDGYIPHPEQEIAAKPQLEVVSPAVEVTGKGEDPEIQWQDLAPQDIPNPEDMRPPTLPDPAPVRSGTVISEPQRKRLFAIAMNAGMVRETFKGWLKSEFDYDSSQAILKSDYERICAAAEVYRK